MQIVGRQICSFAIRRDGSETGLNKNLPDDFHDVLSLMGQALHDSVRTPTIAENFDCLPEQLLDRVRRLNVPAAGR